MMRVDCFAVKVIRTCGALVAALAAQEIDPDPRVWLEAGIDLTEAETEIGLFEPGRSRGTLILLGDQLGFETNASRIDVTLGAKIDDRFFAEASVFAPRRSTQATRDDTIEREDGSYPLGARVDSDFETDVSSLSFGCCLVKMDNAQMTAMAGARLTDFVFRVVREATVGTGQRTAVESGCTVLATLPVVGLPAKHRPAKWLGLRTRGDVFDIEVGAYDDRLVDLEALATAAVAGKIAAGLGFWTTDYLVRINAELDYSFDGLRLFLRPSF